MNIAWSVLAGGIAFLFYRNRQAGILTGLTVFGHWFLDFLSNNNMPVLWRDSPTIGIGLINSGPGVAIGIAVETGLIIGGFVCGMVWLKRRSAPKPE
jgi:hypothetical protein